MKRGKEMNIEKIEQAVADFNRACRLESEAAGAHRLAKAHYVVQPNERTAAAEEEADKAHLAAFGSRRVAAQKIVEALGVEDVGAFARSLHI